MAEIPVFRIHTERIDKDRFLAVADHLGLRGDIVETEEALFVHDKQRALAYAQPGSRFGGLLFFTDQGIAETVERPPAEAEAEGWTTEFFKRFQLGPRTSQDERVRVSTSLRVFRTESVIEEGQETTKIRRAPHKTELVSDIRVNEYYVTGPRAKFRAVFKSARRPAWMHRALWDKLEVFEMRPLLSEDEIYRRLSDRLSRRGESRRVWRMIGLRLAYFAGEFTGGPDLLLPYYFADVEFTNPKVRETTGQGPRQLIQIHACP